MDKIIASLLVLSVFNVCAGDKLIATSAVNSIQGSAGGGLIPFAVLPGYASDNEWAASVFTSHSELDDFSLETMGFAINYHDRVELSYAKMIFGIDAAPTDIRLNVVGAKLRLYGDVIYSTWPQLSVGIEHKSLVDFTIPASVGAKSHSGTDLYVTASKVWLDGIAHHSILLDLNVRWSKANQIGFLGFGGDQDNDRDLSLEGAAGFFFNRQWLMGVEYRQKSDHLTAVKEDDWQSVFISYFPNKSLSITAAYLDLGAIAGAPQQTGYYIALQGAF